MGFLVLGNKARCFLFFNGEASGVPGQILKNMKVRNETLKSRMLTLLLTLAMIASLIVPAYAVDEAPSGQTGTELVTAETLAALDAGQTVTADTITQEDAMIFLLRYAGMADTQLSPVAQAEDPEQFAYDCTELAKSLGLLNGVTYQADAACTAAQFAVMQKNVQVLYDALHADKLQPLFVNGMAQPIFPYTTGAVEEGYSNDDSDIIRFFVYVETNYDTDGDGKLDLVKALVQIPRAAMEGDYQAATIYEARPYITGCTDRSQLPLVDGGYDIDSMYSQPAARVPQGSATTAEVAAAADSSDWYYWNEYEDMWDYEDLTWYDYYLVRGFAVVECGGLGTRDSEGFETCGTDLEIDAFKCVIEWLHGDRVAYTDKTSNITIDADWSNGKVGMTGRSYAGTTQFGLATTGVEGLETIVPVAGIASWYEYTNSQGVATRNDPAYSEWLAAYCTGRFLDPEDYATIEDSYGRYMQEIRNLQLDLNGDYGEHWAIRDYTVDPLMDDWTGIQIPALIVHGLNDTNVRTKEFDLMYDAFVKAGQNVKLLLHQGTHLTPTYPAQEYELYINGEYYDSILNRWFSHYLYGVDNGAEDMANVTWQSNLDGSWHTYDSWEAAYTSEAACTDAVTADTSKVVAAQTHSEDGTTVTDVPAVTATYLFEADSDVTIQGPVAVHIRAAASAENLSELDGIRMTVGLNDRYEDGYLAYVPSRSYLPISTVREDGAWMGGGLQNFRLVKYDQTETTSKSIGLGYIDVFNPTAGYTSASAAVRTDLVDGQYYDYTVYIQPTLYTLVDGHALELTIEVAANSGITLTIDNANTYIELPTQEKVTFSRAFLDVQSDVWFANAVKYVVDEGIFSGMTQNTFEPQGTMTRGMMATVLYNLAGRPAVSGQVSFADVETGSWYYDAILWASQNNIVSGFSQTQFAPNANVTREQMVVMLCNYAKYLGMAQDKTADVSTFTDADSISSYAVSAMEWACGEELVHGYEDGTVAPLNSIKRCEVALIMMNFSQLTA